ncbi:hypothetical protein GCM10008956_40080 [Deinococcus arenae]|uniref:Uncharacterized protein n=1 Tax=Deinococcus arenae TaxID=1452751 RepID=A0A8H9GSX5_9DEIO|nr:hypothetical protein GCM10008956_40080 [Deinococcus arenae]
MGSRARRRLVERGQSLLRTGGHRDADSQDSVNLLMGTSDHWPDGCDAVAALSAMDLPGER